RRGYTIGEQRDVSTGGHLGRPGLMIGNPVTTLNRDSKVLSVFGNLAIDKRRLPMSQLQKRGVPAYVGEWVLDSIVPGEGPLSETEAARVQAWANKYIPAPDQANIIKNRLMNGEIVKVLTPV